MKNFKDQIFACLDCETTGLDPVSDRIIEVAVILFNDKGIIDQFETLVNPQCNIPEESIAIHHIRPEMVADKPTIDMILPKVLNFVGGHIIVGHGVGFDIDLLANAAARHSFDCTIKNNLVLDTLRMARLYGRSPVNSLEQLRKHFNIDSLGAHRAMSDVMVNMEVFKCLSIDYKSTHHLFEVLSRPIEFKTMPLGKHKGRPLREVPLEYLIWASHKDFDQDLLFSIKSEIKRRKRGNLFSQSSNPFQNL